MGNSEQLEKIAISETSLIRCSETPEKLEDQTRIANVATNASDEFVRIIALRRLTEPQKLAEIAIADSSVDVCLGALYQLNDQGQIRRVANEARDPMVKAAAANKHVDGRHTASPVSQSEPPSARYSGTTEQNDILRACHEPSRTPFEQSSGPLDMPILDGSRGLGQFRREAGRYGSFPAHDDHGDEARS